MNNDRLQVWIDRGGTFTDCLGVFPDGTQKCVKVLSSDKAPLDGIRQILNLSIQDSLPSCDVKMGTTLATNALLERKGEDHVLLISKGFKDVLRIGTQQRPDLFDLHISLPTPLSLKTVEIEERIDAHGRVIVPLSKPKVKKQLIQIYKSGVRSIAIVFLHGYSSVHHEQSVAALARQIGFTNVSCSHEVCPEIGLTSRGDTTTVDAYLTPLLSQYMAYLQKQLSGSDLQMMQSNGGLVDASLFRGANAIMSGPAAGVVACARLGDWFGFKKIIGFDMGGTSTDVSRYDGQFEYSYETITAGVKIKAPMLKIHTVASGGGSICRVLGGRLVVGPESAGSSPGPLCYGLTNSRGKLLAKELTVTDVNYFLGRVVDQNFPFALHKEPVVHKLKLIQEELKAAGQHLSLERIAEGFLDVVNHQMSLAVKEVSVAQGHDVREYSLCSFGGAGGQHACAIARLLGIQKVFLHPYGGILSAYGIGLADSIWSGSAPVRQWELNDENRKKLGPQFARLMRKGGAIIRQQGFPPENIYYLLKFDLRYVGTENTITITEPKDLDYAKAFAKEHRKLFGYVHDDRTIEIIHIRVDVVGKPEHARPKKWQRAKRINGPVAFTNRTMVIQAKQRKVPVYHRKDLDIGDVIVGPAIILEQIGTLVVDSDFRATVDVYGNIILDPIGQKLKGGYGTALDPIALEVFNNIFMSIAQQMGQTLQRTAISSNVKDRLDFSCALFDQSGRLVANAPHIPVHLGAMGQSVRAVIKANSEMQSGDVFVTNNPFDGGTHLPDITVVTPIFYRKSDKSPTFYTACRAHHADVGGITPGSVPAFSKNIDEEGVLLDQVKIVAAGQFQEKVFEQLFSQGRYPARNINDNRADLQAQIAANHMGLQLIDDLCCQQGIKTVVAYMKYVRENAAYQVQEALGGLPDGEYRFEDQMDEGARIKVSVCIKGKSATIDFAGTAKQQNNNLNAPPAIVRSSILYVLRSLVKERIPLNEGCLDPVAVRIPSGSLLNPNPGCAVVGGNVETSQRITDCLLGALKLAAASQGTMNNVTFGSNNFGYYETIAGGVGAAKNYNGADAVHTHMTNTRITDAEILETRFPIRLIEFGVRKGSGGNGKYQGGCGVVRRYEFLQKLNVSLLTERRTNAPFGLKGGSPGQVGRNVLVLANGKKKKLNGKVSFTVKPGERLEIHTPGGGGYGRK